MENIKAVIFDLDGTLVDSMWVWSQIDIDFLTSRGHSIPDNLHEEITHLTFKQTAEYFKNFFSLEDSVEELISSWNSMAHYHYSNTIKFKKGALEFIIKLKNLGIKIGLATSNSTLLLEAVLNNNNAIHLFDAITTTDEVCKSKNYPEVYISTAKKLGVSPKDCMVFEDIIAAVNGAKLAGMKVTGVYDEASKDQEIILKGICDNYIYSYDELI